MLLGTNGGCMGGKRPALRPSQMDLEGISALLFPGIGSERGGR